MKEVTQDFGINNMWWVKFVTADPRSDQRHKILQSAIMGFTTCNQHSLKYCFIVAVVGNVRSSCTSGHWMS